MGAASRYQRDVESGTDPPAKVDAAWNASLTHIFVPEVTQRRPNRLEFVVWFRPHHHVDDWFSEQPWNGRAPDVFDRDIYRQAQ